MMDLLSKKRARAELILMRHRLTQWKLLPLSKMARTFWVSCAIAFASWMLAHLPSFLGQLFRFVFWSVEYFALWPIGLWLVFRWTRNTVLWRVRNRLMVTYGFIGGVPILLLLALAGIAAYFLAGQFSTFLASNDLQSEMQRITVENRAIAAHLQAEARSGKMDVRDVPEIQDLAKNEGTDVELFGNGAEPVSRLRQMSAAILRPAWVRSGFNGIVRDRDRLYFRAAYAFSANGKEMMIISSEEITSQTLNRALAPLGEVSIADVENRGAQENMAADTNLIIAGTLPPPVNRLDEFPPSSSPVDITDWRSGEQCVQSPSGDPTRCSDPNLRVVTRPSILYSRLFETSGGWKGAIAYVLAGTAIAFAFLEIFALFIGARLTRSITHAVAELYGATRHIERGNFSHRIRLRSNDQLAALEANFNQMADSLGKLLREQREKQRLEGELAIAQEVQAQLFPRMQIDEGAMEMFGQCLPARTVSGDYYDFLDFSNERIGIAMGDISGKGISAALLMATVQSAVRAYEFGRGFDTRALAASSAGGGGQTSTSRDSEISPASAMYMLNRHLYFSTPAEKYATMFMGVFDARTRVLTYTNAGHLPPLIICADGSTRKLEISGTVVGLFDDVQWSESTVHMDSGDIFVAYSDGVTEPENEFGEFGEERLIELLVQYRTLPLSEIVDRVFSAVREWVGTSEQPDDITLVLARARS